MTQDLSAKEYAAIHLRVPESGTEWLDNMIARSARDEAARLLAPALATMPFEPSHVSARAEKIAQSSYAVGIELGEEGKSYPCKTE